MKHTISVLVENKFGVLARIAGLFSARGYNISSLAVSETLDPSISYLTMVVDAKDEGILEQIKKQLNKLIDVITVTDFTKKGYIDRELVLLKIQCPAKDKGKLESAVKKFTARIIQSKKNVSVVEVMGSQDDIFRSLEALSRFGIKELIRTGKIAIASL